ncbi:MAG TPA: non-homologous end-joining DNA ligase [Allosphingosinicella sp.]|nr:non-homologous end-joining DNA ligase [Allosphingosinicella sp.]
MLEYYVRLAPLVLEHAARRPLNLFRCTSGHCFFQRNRRHPAPKGEFGAPIRFHPIAQKNGRTEEYLWVDDAAGLLACVEAEGIEFHGWGSCLPEVERPDRIALDLDPGEGVTFAEVRSAAFTLRDGLGGIGLASFPLLTGGKGIHVVIPLLPEAEWPQVREFARSICAALAALEPERFTVSLPKAERKRRIFLDWLRNQRTATAILPYSLRARVRAPVAAPVTWEELPEIEGAGQFTLDDAGLLLKRGRSRALRGWGRAEQRLPAVR